MFSLTKGPLYPSVHLREHKVETATQRGWHTLKNGELLRCAEDAGFDVLVTPDKNIKYQQNLGIRKIALVVFGNPQWPILHPHVERVVAAVNSATPGSYAEVEIPVNNR